MDILFPVFLMTKDSGEILKFNTIEEMGINLEAIDVENQEYIAWDKNGRRVILSTQKPSWLLLEYEALSKKENDLKQKMLEYAKNIGMLLSPEETSTISYQELYTLIEQYAKPQRRNLFSRFFSRNNE